MMLTEHQQPGVLEKEEDNAGVSQTGSKVTQLYHPPLDIINIYPYTVGEVSEVKCESKTGHAWVEFRKDFL